jgi:hypothetical protein
MIRTVLASPWFSLSNWFAVLIAVLLVAQHKSLKYGLRKQEPKPPVSIPVPTPGTPAGIASLSQSRSAPELLPAIFKHVNYWYPKVTVFRLREWPSPRLEEEITINKIPVSTAMQSTVPPPITMLSIRAGNDLSGSTAVSTLGIQCRTCAPISNARRNNVTIHGVVTQDVVSSTGRILIMAGSRVVGGGTMDPENGRLKSNGLWSIFVDDTEIKIQAHLLDRSAGMAGILGQETSKEDEALQREAVVREGRYVFVPESASFTLEVYGDISLRDVKSRELSN